MDWTSEGDTPADCGCPPVSTDGAWDLVLPPETGAVPYVYVLERFEIAAKVLDELPFAKTLNDYQFAVRSCLPGWERVFVCGAVTGNPFRFVQLWRVPAPLDLAGALVSLESQGGAGYRAFLAGLVDLERHILFPMPYDPALAGTPATEPATRDAVVLIDEVKVKRGALRRLACLKERFFTPRVASLGFRLVASATMVTGRPGTLIQCWQLRDSNTLLRAMRVLSENETYRAHLAPCVESESQGLYEQLIAD